MLNAIQTLWIESLPPLLFALGDGQFAVIGNTYILTLFVGAMRSLEPPPIPRVMDLYPES